MKKILKKSIIVIAILIFGISINSNVFAAEAQAKELTEEFKEWLALPDEQKTDTVMPRMYDVPESNITSDNYLKNMRMVGSVGISKYSLRDVIPENVVVRNQKTTNTCWAFSAVAMLESTLALNNYNNNATKKIYDFSERHMDYAVSRNFINGTVNSYGYNRNPNEGDIISVNMAKSYLTNGMGAVEESLMPFSTDMSKISLSEINKTVSTQVDDIVYFPTATPTTVTETMKDNIKNHIKNYGAVTAAIYGASLMNDCYNNDTGALYCDDSVDSTTGYSKWQANHSVAIVGWDDSYSKSNFNSNMQPKNDGAWIIKNSWGATDSYTLTEMKELIYNLALEQTNDEGVTYAKAYGWTSANSVSTEFAKSFFEQNGYTVTDTGASLKIGDNGFMYISYEDVNVYSQMVGIEKAEDEVEYDNLYQYDKVGSSTELYYNSKTISLGTIFTKSTSSTEYLTQVALSCAETYTCKVYVNPTGASFDTSKLQQVKLKAGNTETVSAGYHTLEFASPVEITGNQYAVVIEITSNDSNTVTIPVETNWEMTNESYYFGTNTNPYKYIEIESGKCFLKLSTDTTWTDCSTDVVDVDFGTTSVTLKFNGYDTSIKAFTTNELNDGSLKEIKITTPPNKTSYIEGEDFDKTGMVVTAYYNTKDNKEVVITDYNITNGTSLSSDQKSVTVSYNGKEVTQAITVSKNEVTNIAIKTPPTKTDYIAGDEFDKTGMVVEVTYTDGTTKTVTDYTVKDGTTLKNGQTSVTISYGGKEVTQAITVAENKATKIEITKAPSKTSYYAGDDFDKTGMVVEVTYANGTKKEVTDYTITNGTNLQEGQTSVTISYEELQATQKITVTEAPTEKTITGISVKTKPTKLTYIQNKENLDLSGGVITVKYSDGTTEDIDMKSSDVTATGFDNTKVGTDTITVKYNNFSATFDVEIKEAEAEVEGPENSNFDKIALKFAKSTEYMYTDTSKTDYAIMDFEVSNIVLPTTKNDSMRYYYYISTNSSETTITDWTEIKGVQVSNGKISFSVNTKDLSNYDEISKADKIYLYVKEIATKNSQSSSVVSYSMKIGDPETVESYLDGVKKETDTKAPTKSDDNTVSTEKFPFTGKEILVGMGIIAIIGFGVINYIKYKNIDK